MDGVFTAFANALACAHDVPQAGSFACFFPVGDFSNGCEERRGGGSLREWSAESEVEFIESVEKKLLVGY